MAPEINANNPTKELITKITTLSERLQGLQAIGERLKACEVNITNIENIIKEMKPVVNKINRIYVYVSTGAVFCTLVLSGAGFFFTQINEGRQILNNFILSNSLEHNKIRFELKDFINRFNIHEVKNPLEAHDTNHKDYYDKNTKTRFGVKK